MSRTRVFITLILSFILFACAGSPQGVDSSDFSGPDGVVGQQDDTTKVGVGTSTSVHGNSNSITFVSDTKEEGLNPVFKEISLNEFEAAVADEMSAGKLLELVDESEQEEPVDDQELDNGNIAYINEKQEMIDNELTAQERSNVSMLYYKSQHCYTYQDIEGTKACKLTPLNFGFGVMKLILKGFLDKDRTKPHEEVIFDYEKNDGEFLELIVNETGTTITGPELVDIKKDFIVERVMFVFSYFEIQIPGQESPEADLIDPGVYKAKFRACLDEDNPDKPTHKEAYCGNRYARVGQSVWDSDYDSGPDDFYGFFAFDGDSYFEKEEPSVLAMMRQLEAYTAEVDSLPGFLGEKLVVYDNFRALDYQLKTPMEVYKNIAYHIIVTFNRYRKMTFFDGFRFSGGALENICVGYWFPGTCDPDHDSDNPTKFFPKNDYKVFFEPGGALVTIEQDATGE